MFVLFLAGLAWPSEGWSRAPRKACVSPDDIARLVQDWTDKLQKAWQQDNPSLVVQTYATEGRGAILVPTCANGPLIGTGAITAYFEKFLADKPVAKIDEDTQTIRISRDCRSALATGLYNFTLTGGLQLAARYTYVYQLQNDRNWRIAHHHSSLQPVPSSKCPVPTQ